MNREEAARSRDKGRRLVRRVTSVLATGGLAVVAAIGITAGIDQKNVSTVGSTSSTTDSSSSTSSSSSSGSSGSSGSTLQSTQAPTSSSTSGAVTSGGS